ncbi:hypothetical protein Taro_022217 [Colocasia esculenta]|uniref:Uncharacterized protein n=1 Tax=Colocasia esculenta TaxID=4460 RepID=A0A843V7S3_COLES|nr:hypothetical protein [Colocasia esculenta]
MEALCKGSLVQRKEYPTESSPQAKRHRVVRMATGVGQVATGPAKGRDRAVCSGGQNATGCPVAFRTRQDVGRDGSENATCRAVVFSGTSPEFERENVLHRIACQLDLFGHRVL